MKKGAFAVHAGVTSAAISQALRGELSDALTPDRKRIYPDHPAAQNYVKGSTLAQKRRIHPPRRRSTPRNGGKPAMLPGEDVFTFSRRMAERQIVERQEGVDERKAFRAARSAVDREARDKAAWAARPGAAPAPPLADGDDPPIWLGVIPGSLAAWSRQYLFDVERGLAGQFPDEIDDLGSMTLREMVDRFGSIENLGGLVKLLKNYADMQHKEAAAAERRGDLISRTVISNSLVPLIDLAFRRLVTEAPGALAEQIIARVLSAAGEGKTGDLRLDVEALIRRETSTILTNCRDRFVQEVES